MPARKPGRPAALDVATQSDVSEAMASRGNPIIASAPLAESAPAWPDYALLDSGSGRKMERYGEVTVVRPEPQCLWAPRAADWSGADAVFEATDDDEAGRWRVNTRLEDTWPMRWGPVAFKARLTAFRHLGVFPEQAANWTWLEARLREAAPPRKILNLFGYTGVASLVAAAAGAEVTHVDASKKAVGWARENATIASLAQAPIRWICEDAKKWVAREQRRGAYYDGVILDPPKYGRGPAGEVWRLLEDLPDLIAGCAGLLSEDADFFLLNAYSERLSGLALAGLLASALEGRGGQVEWGELVLRERERDRGAGLSFFARWTA